MTNNTPLNITVPTGITTENCGGCFCFYPVDEKLQYSEGSMNGLCRRFPPQTHIINAPQERVVTQPGGMPVIDPKTGKPQVEITMTSNIQSMYPITNVSNWCGEYTDPEQEPEAVN